MRSICGLYETGAEEVARRRAPRLRNDRPELRRVPPRPGRGGVSEDTIATLNNSGIELSAAHRLRERRGRRPPESEAIRNHPLLPRGVPVHGLLICPDTGKLDLLVDGYAPALESQA